MNSTARLNPAVEFIVTPRLLEYEFEGHPDRAPTHSRYAVLSCIAAAIALTVLVANALDPIDLSLMPLAVPAVMALFGCAVVGCMLSVLGRERRRVLVYLALGLIAISTPLVLQAIGMNLSDVLYELGF
jgi:hypothetical protein